MEGAGGGRGVDPVLFPDPPTGRGLPSSVGGRGVAAPVYGGGGFGGSGHRSWRHRPEVCLSSSSAAYGLPSSSGHNWFPVGGSPRSRSRLAGEALCRGVSSAGSSPFFEDVFRPQAGQVGQAAYHRPVPLEQASQESLFQDGGPSEGGAFPFPRAMGRENRPEGCLPSFASGSSGGEVLRLCPGEKDLRLSGSPFWAVPSSLALHQGDEARKEGFASVGYPDISLSGRLPFIGPFPSRGVGPRRGRDRPPAKVRVSDQLEEVGSGSPETPGISRCNSRLGGNDFLPSPRKGGESPLLGGVIDLSCPEEVGVGDACRLSKFRSGLCSPGKALAETGSSLGKCSLVASGPACPSGDGLRSARGPSPLGRQVVSRVLGSGSGGFPIPGPDDRCLSSRLGRCFASTPGSGQVGLNSADPDHELVGVEGDSSVPSPFSPAIERSLCVPAVGQRDCSLVHQEAGLPLLSGALVSVSGNSGSGPAVWNSPGPSTPAGSFECFGRQSVTGRPHFNRVVPGRLDFPGPLRGPRYPTGGFDGNPGERQALHLCVPVPGQPGFSDGRLLLRLESLGFRLYFSALPASPGGRVQVGLLPGEGFPRGSHVALRSVVHPSCQSVSSQTSPPRGSCSFPADGEGPRRIIQGVSIPTSRLDIMRDSLGAEGFSRSAMDIILDCHKQSTCAQYQSTWVKFLDFLDSEGVRPDRLRLCHVHNFLAHEAEVGNKAYRTIATYKCALALPLKICFNLDLDGVRTKKFMMGAWNRNPPRSRPMPLWDLSDLLFFLRSDRFEDLRSVSFDLLTQKVLALLLIASGRRISEIANLSRVTLVRGSRTYIEWLPSFRAKWCSGFTEFVPQSPSVLRMKSSNARYLRNCPVRALEIFLERRNSVVCSRDDDCLWTLGKAGLASSFRSLVKASRRHWSKSVHIDLYPHHAKKFAVSYSWKYFRNVEDSLPARTGNRSASVLKKSYLGPVPDIRLPCVVPLGTIFPIS